MDSDKRYCSVVLINNMEYMVVIEKDWVKNSFADGFFQAKTLDGKPILFGKSRITMLREIDEAEYDVWKANLDSYREDLAQKAEKEESISNIKV